MTENILWVNYDAGSMKTRPHRERIFHYIQKNYRPREKQERARALRATAKIPKNLRRLQQPTQRSSVKQEKSASDESSVDGEGAKHRLAFEDRSRATSPDSVLKKGNSDPFHALAVPINAEENRVVAFYRDFMLPAAYNVDSIITKDILANVRAKADFELCIIGLQDRGTALAFIASNTSLVAIASNSPSLHHKSLAMRSRSMAALRKKLTVVPRSDPLLWWHINHIWVAENAASNGPAAVMHGNMLSKLMHEYFDSGGSLFDVLEEMKGRRVLELMLFFMWADSNMATQFLVRPSFDVYEWLPKTFAPFLKAAAPIMFPVPVQSFLLDPVIDSEELIWCFDTCREIFTRWRERKGSKYPEMIAAMNMCQGLYKWSICLGKLISRYCTFHELCQSTSEPSQWEYAQQYLSLAAIRWSRAEIQNDTYGKHLWVGKVMDALRSVLDHSRCPVGSETWDRWKNARLWSLYIGATFEVRRYSSSDEWQRGWFNINFTRHARAMGLTVWADVTAILTGFLFDSAASEFQERWFETTMRLTSSQKNSQ